MTEEKPGCEEWLRNQGLCDLDAGHYPETPHLLVNIDDGIYWKITWPLNEDDPDVKRYDAASQAYEDEDNRQMAERARS